MPRVFVSYAHSSDEHCEQVQRLARYLRDAGLQVVIDSDVKSPAGPKEQWPRWMKNQIAAADWVLLFVDETYRRRFDGNEEHGKGLGANWEGCIVTHQLYQAATNNERFIPVLSDGADANLIPIEIIGANRYSIPAQQHELAQAILAYEAGGSESHADGVDHSAIAQLTPAMDAWRTRTVGKFADAFLMLQSSDRRTKVAETVGFAPDDDREHLCAFLDELIRRYTAAGRFDVESISLMMAEFDALRSDAAADAPDQAILTQLQDLLLPLCIHPEIKADVARQMEQHGVAIIDEAVALEIGAELAAAPADVRQAGFRLDDSGKIAGDGLLRFVDAAVGNPNPDQLVCDILLDLADQLSVGLDEDIDDEQDTDKRVDVLTARLKLQAKAFRIRKRRRFYCVIRPPANDALQSRLVKLLARVRGAIPEIVFFELHRKSPTKPAEEIVMQILKDRFSNEGMQ